MLTLLRRVFFPVIGGWGAVLALSLALCASAPAQTPLSQVITTTLYRFSPLHGQYPNQTNSDGAFPSSAVIQGRDGYFYGVSSSGGKSACGTLWRYIGGGPFTVLHTFHLPGYRHDGINPSAQLVQSVQLRFGDRRIYGTTFQGGLNNTGTVFRYSTIDGTYRVLHSFSALGAANTDGAYPAGGLTEAPNGVLFGTTSTGGINGNGTVYEIDPEGPTHAVTTLYSFTGHNSQSRPGGNLLLASDGLLYGATGDSIYRIDPQTGAYKRLYAFPNGGSNGFSSLIQGPDGALYGLHRRPPGDSRGALYRVDLTASPVTVTVLHHFFYQTNGLPSALVQARDGNLYGTTTYPNNTLWRYDLSSDTFEKVAGYGGYVGLAGLTLTHDGTLFGVASTGRRGGTGLLFRVDLGL